MKILHIATHRGWQEASRGGSGINSGDTCLNEVIQAYFRREFPGIEIHSRQIWERVYSSDVSVWNTEYDFIMIGGGGQLLNDQPGLDESLSGWTWQISYKDLTSITVPFIFYSVGYNRFTYGSDFSDLLWKSLHYIYLNSVFFSMRNSGSIERVCENFSARRLEMPKEIVFQPCLTTIYSRLFNKDFDTSLRLPARIAVNIAVDRIGSRISYSQESFYKYCCEMIVGLYALESIDSVDLICHKQIDGLESGYVNVINATVGRSQKLCKSVDLTRLDSEQIYQVYSQYDLTIGMRGHGVMIPTGCGKPTFSLISHPKLQYLLDDLGISHLPVSHNISSAFNTSEIISRVRSTLEQYDHIRLELATGLDHLLQITLANTKTLKSYLDA